VIVNKLKLSTLVVLSGLVAAGITGCSLDWEKIESNNFVLREMRNERRRRECERMFKQRMPERVVKCNEYKPRPDYSEIWEMLDR